MTETGCVVSIVVPTRNRRALVELLLNNLAEQTFDLRRVEILVVNDGGTDGTPALVEEFARTHSLNARCLEHPGLGTAAARNHGLSQARGELMLFVDDDVTLRADHLANAVRHFERPELGVVESRLLRSGTEQPFLRNAAHPGFITNAIYYRRSVLETIGGFDEAFFDPETRLFFRDDLELGFRALAAGVEALQPPDLVAWHPDDLTTLSACFRFVRRYQFDALLYRKHPAWFRRRLERKRLGPFEVGRPLHYACLAYCLAMPAAALALAWGAPATAAGFGALALAAYAAVRVRFQRKRALQLWRLTDTVGFAVVPYAYLTALLRGCRKYGGWWCLL